MPSIEFERRFWKRGITLVAGVDEVGRGCLAGPVVAAACVLPMGTKEIPGVRDSKKLNAEQRNRLFEDIKKHALAVGVGAASRAEIDRYNIRAASVLAMQRALRRLGSWDHALCDGPLGRELDPSRHSGIVDGDDLCLSIACASIIAKVTRDRLMVRLAKRYPDFGWDRNAGYGTAHHLEALSRYGCTPHHRHSFAPVRRALESVSTLERD